MSEFCQHTDHGRRCVLRRHGEDARHELMPFRSASVTMITRQEEAERKASDPPPVGLVDKVITAIDKVVEKGK